MSIHRQNPYRKARPEPKTPSNRDSTWGSDTGKKALEIAAQLLQEGHPLAYVRRVGLSMALLAEKD